MSDFVISNIRSAVSKMVHRGSCGTEVLELLWDDGDFTYHEDVLWDFKADCNVIEEKKNTEDYVRSLCELVKDIASFYNSSGGYLIIGFEEKKRELIGFDKHLLLDDLKSRVEADLGLSIDFVYRLVSFQNARLGLLFIPRRPDNDQPAQFVKNSKGRNSRGNYIYEKNDVFGRFDDSCRKAQTPADYSFLFSRDTGMGQKDQSLHKSIVYANLPSRDPTLVEFFGRSSELRQLWEWMFDKYNPTRLVTGLGGMGKTTLVREFCEQIEHSPPVFVNNILWFGAKKYSFRADLGRPIANTGEFSPDFSTPTELYKLILENIAFSEEEIEGLESRDEFIDALSSGLAVISAFIVVDDLDTLSPDDQAEIFQTLNTAIGLANRVGVGSSRAIFTSRINLGAAPAQLLQVQGIARPDFLKLTRRYANALDIKQLKLSSDSKVFRRLFDYSGGSPLFLKSILQLVALGEPLDKALNDWRDNEGEDVRNFAFRRELEQLSDRQRRLLYALCVSKGASRVELEEVLQQDHKTLNDDLTSLRRHHLAELPDSEDVGGFRYAVSRSISLLQETIKSMITDPKAIERRIIDIHKAYSGNERDVAHVIRRTVALWQQDRADDALGLVEYSVANRPNANPSLLCLLGRCYLKVRPQKLDEAENALERAFGAGCRRNELFDDWCEVLTEKEDWNGLLAVCEKARRSINSGRFTYRQAVASNRLAGIIHGTGNLASATTLYLKAGRLADQAYHFGDAAIPTEDIKSLRKESFESSLSLAARDLSATQEGIEIFQIAAEAFECYVRSRFVISVMTNSVSAWAEHVAKRREVYDENTHTKFDEAIGLLHNYLQEMKSKQWVDTEAITSVVQSLEVLSEARDRFGDKNERIV
ncbi:RNA-binding domain-containing protein [Yoonia sp. 2307UL14-13]|uniref:RNA-binding domain-containing protein n=1 Tax=Yoonia sp. 2307UL14-13 TaxID=3126506 RepID=UPI0030B60A0E